MRGALPTARFVMRLAIVTSHPIQYYAPLFRDLARRLDLIVFYAHRATALDQATAGFGTEFAWDTDLLSGYEHRFLTNVSASPGLDHFGGCDTPGIAANLRAADPDVVMVTGWHLKTYLQAVWAAKRLGLPTMARGDSHLDTPRSPSKRIAKAITYPVALRAFNAALYVGQRSREYWRHYHYPGRKLFFSPHAVDTEWFAARATPEARAGLRAKLGIAPDAKVALFAGKLMPFKRPLDLIAAAGGTGIEVLVAGAGELGGAMRRAASDAGVRLHMLGFCNQSEMPTAYAASDVLVLPSDGRETWGLVANEALACGKPVLVSDACGCAPDLAADGHAGEQFATSNVAELRHALSRVLHFAPKSPAAIREKSEQHSLREATRGIVRATDYLFVLHQLAKRVAALRTKQ